MVDVEKKLDAGEDVVFGCSVCGTPLFRLSSQGGRTYAEFFEESSNHGWPSFRTSEVIWENIQSYDFPGHDFVKQGGLDELDGNNFETHCKTCGAHLGHNIPDAQGMRLCIDVGCISGHVKVVSSGSSRALAEEPEAQTVAPTSAPTSAPTRQPTLSPTQAPTATTTLSPTQAEEENDEVDEETRTTVQPLDDEFDDDDPVFSNAPALDNCGVIVPRGTKRVTWLLKFRRCKCPKGYVIAGEDQACKKFLGQRYFNMKLPPLKCRCEWVASAVAGGG